MRVCVFDFAAKPATLRLYEHVLLLTVIITFKCTHAVLCAYNGRTSSSLLSAQTLAHLTLRRRILVTLQFSLRNFAFAYTAFDSEIAFAILLGPTDPCSIAVSMEPFSTLALKGLT